MKAFILSDKEFETKKYLELSTYVINYLKNKGIETNEHKIEKDELEFCMGCFGCWVKKPGECVIGDHMALINQTYINSDIAIYLCPVVFGQCSANMKTVLDRWIPNILPFFEVRPDGSTIHPARYTSYPKQIFIAYSDSLTKDDATLFTDILQKHRRELDVITYINQTELKSDLDNISLKKVGGKI